MEVEAFMQKVVFSAAALLYVGLRMNMVTASLWALFWRLSFALCPSVISNKTLKCFETR